MHNVFANLQNNEHLIKTKCIVYFYYYTETYQKPRTKVIELTSNFLMGYLLHYVVEQF